MTKSRTFGVACLVIVILATMSCRDLPAPESMHLICGTVVDAESNTPLDSAWVALGDTLAYEAILTNENGEFCLVEFPFSVERPLYAGKNGYATSHISINGLGDNLEGLTIPLSSASESDLLD